MLGCGSEDISEEVLPSLVLIRNRGRSFGSRGLLSSCLWCSVRMWQSIMGNSPLTCCCSSYHHSRVTLEIRASRIEPSSPHRSPPFLSFSPSGCSSDSEVTPPPLCGVGVLLAPAGLRHPLWNIFPTFLFFLLSSKHLVDDLCVRAFIDGVPVMSHDVLFLNETFGVHVQVTPHRCS